MIQEPNVRSASCHSRAHQTNAPEHGNTGFALLVKHMEGGTDATKFLIRPVFQFLRGWGKDTNSRPTGASIMKKITSYGYLIMDVEKSMQFSGEGSQHVAYISEKTMGWGPFPHSSQFSLWEFPFHPISGWWLTWWLSLIQVIHF